MKKLLFLIPSLDKGGAENVLLNLVNSLDLSKYHITVQTLFDENSQRDLLKKGIEYKTIWSKPIRGYSKLFALIPAKLLYKLIIREKYDIAISYLEGPTTHIISGCPYKETKKVAWLHTTFDTDSSLKVGFVSKSQALSAYEKMHKIVFVANSSKKKFEETAKKEFSNACVLYNIINNNDIIRSANEAIEDVEFDKNCINVISVGRVIKVKGYDRLAQVHKRLLENGLKHNVYIVGTGEEKRNIEKYLKEERLSESFIFLGFKENPYKYLAKGDLFICSSRREGFSTAVSEALILGIPVISTDCSGACELLGENNEYGLVVENNEEGIYDGLQTILSDQELMQHYRGQAEKRGKMFSIEESVKKVEDLFDALLR